MNIKILISIFIFTFIASYLSVQHFVIKSFNVVEVQGTFSTETKIHIDTSNGIYPINALTRVSNSVAPSANLQTIKFNLSNRIVKSFRLLVEHGNNDFTVSKISLFSHFVDPVIYKKNNLTTDFTINNDDSTTSSLTLISNIHSSNHALSILVSILIASCFMLLLGNATWLEFAAIKDFLAGQQENTHNYASLDGFRGLAALLVLVHHSTAIFKGVGDLGVWMFFVLSGFLLTRPFATDHSIVINKQKMLNFIENRFKRIVPMFFFMVTIIFLIPGSYEKAIRHYLFIQGDGHFWTILQEMYFYALLPIIGLAIYLCCRRNNIAAIVLLIIISILWRNFGTSEIFSIYGLNLTLRAYFEVFIIGMIGAYFYHGIYKKNEHLKQYYSKVQPFISLIALALLLSLIYMSMTTSEAMLGFYLQIKSYSLVSASICLFLILSAVIGKDCLYKKVLCNPVLRYIGIIGYSFYLIHPYAIFLSRNIIEHSLLTNPNTVNWLVTIMSFVITIVLSSFTYAFIERPFLNKRTALSAKKLAS